MTWMISLDVLPSSPRTRRYFPGDRRRIADRALFSAHAEVFPLKRSVKRLAKALLRARGGISQLKSPWSPTAASSPRTRRYFRYGDVLTRRVALFSAHAEVFPAKALARISTTPLLRARGGISPTAAVCIPVDVSSPRTRRYFQGPLQHRPRRSLFSAHAEVFPEGWRACPGTGALLRARGGISHHGVHAMTDHDSSPRTRRYFRPATRSWASPALFSAHAEVFPSLPISPSCPETLLRARGGISTPSPPWPSPPGSSPRTRRYFLESPAAYSRYPLFSAHAEVFPPPRSECPSSSTLLRARGGISNLGRVPGSTPISSPRTRRYFRVLRPAERDVRALLRARGGISTRPSPVAVPSGSSPRTRRYFPPPRLTPNSPVLFSAHAEVFP